MMQQLWALLLLAVALVRTWATWPLRRRAAPRRFREHYGPDGLWPSSSELSQALREPGHCTGCRRCDAVRPSAAAGHDGREDTPGRTLPLSYIVQAHLRSLPDADLAQSAFAPYGEADLTRAEELCPYGVSLSGLARQARLAGAERSSH